jgi:hypothetical protein
VGSLMDYGARFYSPLLGRFISADSIVPRPGDPQSLNRYSYVRNNPLQLTDPSGHCYVAGTPGVTPVNWCGEERKSSINLTSWLARTLHANATGPKVQQIRRSMQPFSPGLTGEPSSGLAGLLVGLLTFKEQVQDHAQWDFKHKIYGAFKNAVFLCGTKSCLGVEYSTAGNIHYGFVGKAADIDDETLLWAAGYAEVTDPIHRKNGESMTNNPYFFGIQGYYNPEWAASHYDDPKDQAAIKFGIALYDTYGADVSPEQFEAFITNYASAFGMDYVPGPATLETRPDWPYKVGDFDGGQ